MFGETCGYREEVGLADDVCLTLPCTYIIIILYHFKAATINPLPCMGDTEL